MSTRLSPPKFLVHCLNQMLNVPGCELAFGDCEGVSQMKPAVHVRIGECGHELLAFAVRRSVDLMQLLSFPNGLHLSFNTLKGLHLERTLALTASHFDPICSLHYAKKLIVVCNQS